MCELLSLAKKDYQGFVIMKKSDDESVISLCCYLLQQAIEKVLKCGIELKGKKFEWTHDIGDLYDTFKSAGWGEIPGLGMIQDTLTLWESKSRYKADFKADLNVMQQAVDVYLISEKMIINYLRGEGTLINESKRYVVEKLINPSTLESLDKMISSESE